MSKRPDTWHRATYESLFPSLQSLSGTEPTPWDDLTDEQKDGIRRANDENADFMNDLGNAIRTGGPLPTLFRS